MGSENPGIRLIRLVLPVLLSLHAAARIRLGIVDDFGDFLVGVGFPAGVLLAWSITVWELLGSALLVARRFVLPVCVLFSVQLLAGIVLVHGAEGWFVVGAGRNGMEYSVLLVAAFLAVAWSEAASRRERSDDASPS